MKIAYTLDKSLTKAELEVLDKVLYNRPYGADEYDFDFSVFTDGYLVSLVREYIRAECNVDILDKYSDEYDEWMSAKFNAMRLFPVISAFAKGDTTAVLDMEDFFRQRREYEEMENYRF